MTLETTQSVQTRRSDVAIQIPDYIYEYLKCCTIHSETGAYNHGFHLNHSSGSSPPPVLHVLSMLLGMPHLLLLVLLHLLHLLLLP